MCIETRVYKGNQTTIPSEIRKKHNIKPNDIVELKEDKKGNIIVSFRKKVLASDVIGMVKIKERTNAVKLKKKIYK